MTKWTLFVVLLLPAMMCLKVTHVSINGKEPHLTPLCSNNSIIPFIMCEIRTERWSDGCKLSYRHGHGFENNCSSKVTLKSENQTVYLHLDGLTQEDNGNYTCQCSNVTGTYMVDLSVTVEVSASAQAEDQNSHGYHVPSLFAVTHVSINREEPHLTPLCGNDTIITLIVCKIRTERWSDGCQLLHRHGHDFESNCSSKVTLKRENQTVYLHLDGLTQEDNGNYSCECSNSDGTQSVHLNVTVEVSASAEVKDENSDSQINVIAMGRVALAVMLTVVIFGMICSGKPHRKQQSNPSVMEPKDNEPYSTLLPRESGLYSSVSVYTNVLYK